VLKKFENMYVEKIEKLNFDRNLIWRRKKLNVFFGFAGRWVKVIVYRS